MLSTHEAPLSQMRSIVAFLREYFNPDHGVNKKSVVILNPREPSPAMKELLSSQFFLEKVGLRALAAACGC
jgi:hypothetical protein